MLKVSGIALFIETIVFILVAAIGPSNLSDRNFNLAIAGCVVVIVLTGTKFISLMIDDETLHHY